MDLDGKHVIVTGASRGVGRAISLACAAEGATVYLLARNKDALQEVEKAIKDQGGQAYPYSVDLTDHNQVEKTVSSVVDQCQSIDALINNAGVGHWSDIVETPVETWDNVMNINLRTVFLMCKYVLPHMYKKQFGHVINISSVQAFRGVENLSAYCSSKAALEAFTKCLYLEAKPHGVKVTSVAPSQVNTEFRDHMTNRPPHTEEQKRKMLKPEDVAESVVGMLHTSSTCLPTSLVLEMQGEQ